MSVVSDVDSVIERHQRRLQQHRRFLEAHNGHGDSPTAVRSAAEQDSASAELTESPVVEGHGQAVAAEEGSPLALARHFDDASPGEADRGEEDDDAVGGTVFCSDREDRRSHSRIERGPLIDGIVTMNNSSFLRYAAATSSSHASGSVGFTPERHRRAFTNPHTAEPYMVQSPTRLYDRGQMFVAVHNRQVMAMRGELTDKELQECTFKPDREKAVQSISQRRQREVEIRASSRGVSANGSNSDSNAAGRDGRTQKTFLHNDAARRSRRPDAWSAPHATTAAARAKSPSLSTTRARGSVARQLALSPSVCNHVARQASARHLREQLARRNLKDGSGWTGEATVPREFHFGSRVSAIPSLRKPVVVDYSHGQQRRQPQGNNQTTGEGRPRRRSEHSGDNDDDDGDLRVSATRSRHFCEDRARTGMGPRLVDDMEEQVPACGAIRSASHRSATGVQGASPVAAEQLHHQEEEIGKLHGLVATLQRELQVAKAKVREVSLCQQVRDQQWAASAAVQRSTSHASNASGGGDGYSRQSESQDAVEL